jgi:hypothetical protein
MDIAVSIFASLVPVLCALLIVIGIFIKYGEPPTSRNDFIAKLCLGSGFAFMVVLAII